MILKFFEVFTNKKMFKNSLELEIRERGR